MIGFDEKEVMQKRIDHFDKIRDDLTAIATEAERQWCLEKGIEFGKRAQLAQRGIPVDQLPPRDLGLTFEQTGVRKVALKNVLRSTYELNRFEPYALSVYSGKSPEKPLISGSMVSMPEDPMGAGELDTSHIMTGGDPFAPGAAVTPGVFSALPDSNDTLEENEWNTIPETPQGRRLAFAKWLAWKPVWAYCSSNGVTSIFFEKSKSLISSI